jgi:hypothetical protein
MPKSPDLRGLVHVNTAWQQFDNSTTCPEHIVHIDESTEPIPRKRTMQ